MVEEGLKPLAEEVGAKIAAIEGLRESFDKTTKTMPVGYGFLRIAICY
ncbi:unnamed protein product [marine sediment metagenome]|uniref:Uncharacterized protein n=1 Tax=marine sediment metagenome TaxID=412755 RepID=X1FGS1_9ZZZZ